MGPHSKAINAFNNAKVYFASPDSVSKSLLGIRVFNNGVAFKQVAIQLGGPLLLIPAETTVFNLPLKSTIWYHDLNMHYESVHVKKQLGEVKEGEWVAPPATIQLPQGFYASITEACLIKYPGMALQSNGQGGLALRLANEQPTSYPYKLRYSAEDTLRLQKPAAFKGMIATPWRVIMIGKDLNSLVNNDIVTNLNPAPDVKLFPNGLQTEWIKPGRAVWKYLNGGGDGTLE
ncbi:MAG: glycoside hydrolase, partial [Pedobacter sp.]